MIKDQLTESVIRSGNSLAVVIPATFVKKIGIKPQDKVLVETTVKTGTITYTFLNVRQLPLV
jgi:antitoxin component of MazEF toxin-antitoxin module